MPNGVMNALKKRLRSEPVFADVDYHVHHGDSFALRIHDRRCCGRCGRYRIDLCLLSSHGWKPIDGWCVCRDAADLN